MITLLLILLALLIYIWYETFRLREYVLIKCQQVCRESSLQLLDQTIALAALSIKKRPGGRFHLYRCYGFEYSINGTDRLRGYVDLMGSNILSVRLEDREGTTIYYH
jgi:hypothetical protein